MTLPRRLQSLYDRTQPDRPDLRAAMKRTRVLWLIEVAAVPVWVLTVGPFDPQLGCALLFPLLVAGVIVGRIVRKGTWLQAAIAWSKNLPNRGLPWLVDALDLDRTRRVLPPLRVAAVIAYVAVFAEILIAPYHHATWTVLIPSTVVIVALAASNMYFSAKAFRRFNERLAAAFAEEGQAVPVLSEDWRAQRRF